MTRLIARADPVLVFVVAVLVGFAAPIVMLPVSLILGAWQWRVNRPRAWALLAAFAVVGWVVASMFIHPGHAGGTVGPITRVG